MMLWMLAAALLAHDAIQVNTATLNVRSGPGTGYAVVGQIKFGQKYVTVSSGGAWKKIWFSSMTAWVHSGYIVDGGGSHQTVTVATLNVRSGPGTNYPIVGTAPLGSRWVVIASSNGWKKIWYGGEARWVFGAYLSSHLVGPVADSLVFVQWADIHCGAWDYASTFRKTYATHLNSLPTKTWPASMGGGQVGPVSHALACGDITEHGYTYEWKDGDSWLGDDYMSLRAYLNFPSYECMGNHDTWGSGAKNGIIALHGNTYYSFNKGGIHFIALDQYVLGSSQAAKPDLTAAELNWLKNDLKTIQKGVTPVVVFMHSPPKQSLGPWWTTMGDTANDLKDLLTGHKVLLILHGHWHKTMKNTWNGWDLIGCGYAANSSYYGASQTLTANIIRIKGNKLWVVPFKLATGQFLEPILVKEF